VRPGAAASLTFSSESAASRPTSEVAGEAGDLTVEFGRVRYIVDFQQRGAAPSERGPDRGKEEAAAIVITRWCCSFRREEETSEGDLVGPWAGWSRGQDEG
jgi:hypothetical protein